MNDFQRYLLDEFVEDYRDGRMSRRDFVMKVIGVSGGLAAALGLFSSVGLSAAEIAAASPPHTPMLFITKSRRLISPAR